MNNHERQLMVDVSGCPSPGGAEQQAKDPLITFINGNKREISALRSIIYLSVPEINQDSQNAGQYRRLLSLKTEDLLNGKNLSRNIKSR